MKKVAICLMGLLIVGFCSAQKKTSKKGAKKNSTVQSYSSKPNSAGVTANQHDPKTLQSQEQSTSGTKKENARKKEVDLVRLPSLGGSIFGKDFPNGGKLTNLNTEGFNPTIAFGAQLDYIQGITKNIDFSASLGACISQYRTSKPSTVNFYYASKSNKDGEQKVLVDATFLGNYKFVSDASKIIPYASLGFEASVFDNYYFFPSLPIGGGLQFNLGNGNFLKLQSIFQKGLSIYSKENFVYSFGAVFPIAKAKKKITPNLPFADTLISVKKGISDSDKDGIPDELDKCPFLLGLAKYNGCPVPDTDMDGIFDDVDSCVTQPGLLKFHGCPVPDVDKDGINDDEDSCISKPGTPKYHGCPIPDQDNDGVNDEEDKCPNEPGVASNKGCPEIQTKLRDLAKSIFFNSGTAVISPKAFKTLDEVAKMMKKYPGFKLDIEGHTDNVGNPISNQKISQKRAEAIKKYLQVKGIDGARLYPVGYGQTKPIANNKTPAGKAANRRVELKANY